MTNKNTIQKLRNCVEYCRQQNGRSSCKNCGLDDDMIDAVLAEAEQRGAERGREMVEKVAKELSENYPNPSNHKGSNNPDNCESCKEGRIRADTLQELLQKLPFGEVGGRSR